MHEKWLGMTVESIINDLTAFYQDHSIRSYISELHTHIILKCDRGLSIKSATAQLMSGSLPHLPDFVFAKILPTNNPKEWFYDADSENNTYPSLTLIIGQQFQLTIQKTNNLVFLSNFAIQLFAFSFYYNIASRTK